MVGMTLVQVDPGTPVTAVRRMVGDAKAATPEGRQMCVVYPLSSAWQVEIPLEAIVTREVLGIPSQRTEPHEWLFSGFICVRQCKVVRDRREVLGEFGVLMFRHSGEMAYTRRSSLDDTSIGKATLKSTHPVFTRDVANNVWHLDGRQVVPAIYDRLQALFTWPDEVTLLVQQAKTSRRKWKALELDGDLVGVPTKQSYEWATHAAMSEWTDGQAPA